ncbi:hypothetical protein [Paenibacillus sp. Marseille-Q7038]
MNKKRWIITFISSFALLYILFGFWIAKDTRIILDKAMSADPHWQEYMDQTVFNRINPIASGATSADFSYEASNHKVGFVFPLHFFWVSKTLVTHEYDQPDFGFREPLTMNVKLKNGQWYATNVKIEP